MDYGLYMQTSEVSHLVYSIAQANRTIAKILLVKFKMLRVALSLLLAIAAIAGVHMLAGYLIDTHG